MVSTPKPPSPEATAAAQGQMNKETAIAQANLNAVDYVTPYGNITTTQTGTWSDGTPKYTQTTSLSDAQQAVLDQTQGAQLNLATIANDQSAFLNDYLDKPFTFDNNSAETWAYDLASPRIWNSRSRTKTNSVRRWPRRAFVKALPLGMQRCSGLPTPTPISSTSLLSPAASRHTTRL